MRKAYLFIAAISFLVSSSLAFAQAQTGASVSGVVTDQTGAALRDVAVTIKNVDTGATRTVTTDGGGHYQVSGLPPGRFEVRAAKQGFAEETRTGISLADGQEVTVDIKMQRSAPDACASGHEFATTDCTLTWHGITLYGAYDIGVGWVSHGLPENGYNYEGESLVNRNGYQHRFLVAPNNLSADGSGHQGQGRVSARLVGCVQRFHRHQSAVRPARQRVQDRHHQQWPSQGQLFDRHRRRARGPTLQ